MTGPKLRRLNIWLVLLLTPTLYACGGDTLAPPTIVPTAASTSTTLPTGGLPLTPTPASEPPAATPAADEAGTLMGLPVGVFENSRTQALQQGQAQRALPPASRIKSTDLPGAQELGPPPWVRPGTRITYYSAAATVASRGEPRCKEDPNGEWEDQSGNKFTCTGMPGDPDGSSAGDGLSQIDVLAVEGTDVVLATTLFSIDRISNQFTVAPTGGGKAPGDVIDGVWIHPRRLAEIAATDLTDMKVLRGNYEVEGVTYNAISFVSLKPGSYQSYAYDTETGLLIAATTRTTPSTTLLDSPQTAGSGNAQLYVSRLLGHRQRNVPGLNGTNPSWVARTRQLSYNGTWTFTNPMGSGSPSDTMSFPMDLSVAFSKGGKNWVPFTARSAIHFPPDQVSTGSGVTGGAGQYWMDPRSLAKLKKGQVIDEDPRTRERLVVESAGTRAGAKTAVISSELPGNRSLLTYDLTTGVLVDFQTSNRGTGITILLRLQTMPR